MFLWILPAQFSPSTFSFAFFSFLGHTESQLCTKSERSEWMEGDCDLFVRHIQHRKKKGKGGEFDKIKKKSKRRVWTGGIRQYLAGDYRFCVA